MANLKVKIGELELNTPLVCASGTFGFGEELAGLARFEDIGAVVTKTITLDPRAGNVPPRIFETDCGGVLNSVGLENPGLQGFLNEKLPRLRKNSFRFIVSVGGFSFEEYEEILRHLEKQSGIDAYEINLSCPNIKVKKIISQDEQLTFELVSRLCKITQRTLIVKLTPEVTDIAVIAQAAESAGADALSLVNTFFGMAIDVNTGKPRLGNIYGGYSGRAIRPQALYKVWRAGQSVKIPIIGGGGVEKASDALEFLLAGAAAVSIGTINMVYPDAASSILSGIKTHLEKSNISSLEQLKKMSA